MRHNTLLVGLACLAVGAGCVGPGYYGPGPRYVPTPTAAPMTYDEAVSRGYDYCRGHGYPCQLRSAHETGHGVWKVTYDVQGEDRRGHVRLDFDAMTRQLLNADENVHGREREHEERREEHEVEEHEHHHGHGDEGEEHHGHREGDEDHHGHHEDD